MELVVLMAGEGQRFVKAGFSTPKPFIEVKGRTILDWTMSSVKPLIKDNQLVFAIRSEHDEKYGIVEKLKQLYGHNTRFQKFSATTRGNLETAFITSQKLLNDKSQAVAFLDSDNKYDIVNFQGVLEGIKEKDFGMLCYFQLADKNDLKWAFCAVEPKTHRVGEIREKEFVENGRPMIGFFYWSSVGLFEKLSGEVLQKEPAGKNGEYFMTQAYAFALKNNYPVYAFQSTHMAALGTPEDVEKFATS